MEAKGGSRKINDYGGMDARIAPVEPHVTELQLEPTQGIWYGIPTGSPGSQTKPSELALALADL